MILNKLALLLLSIPLITLNFAYAKTKKCEAEVVNVTGKSFSRSFTVESEDCKKAQCSGYIQYDLAINENGKHIVNYGAYIKYVIPKGKSRAIVSSNSKGAGAYHEKTHVVTGVKINTVVCKTSAPQAYYN